MTKVYKNLKKLIKRNSRKISHPLPLDKYFLKVILPKPKNKETNKFNLPKQFEIPLVENMFIDKYNLPLSQLNERISLIRITNKFSPKSLLNYEGSIFVKDRIESVMSEQLLWKLTNLNGIGKILNKIEKKVMNKLDLTNKSTKLPFKSKNYLDEFTKDKQYLEHFGIKWKRHLEDEIVGKKFQDKFEYVEEFISKRKANEFVTYINKKTQSKLSQKYNKQNITHL